MIADLTLPRVAAQVTVEFADDVSMRSNSSSTKNASRSKAATAAANAPPLVYAPLNQLLQRQSLPHVTKLRLCLSTYQKSCVTINYEAIRDDTAAYVYEGDILSLQSRSYSYDYVAIIHPVSDASAVSLPGVPFDEEEAAFAAPASTTATPPKETTKTPQLWQRLTQDEFTCAICWELQVQSTTMVPCGHSFCHACIRGKRAIQLCPLYNAQPLSYAPNWIVDNCLSVLTEKASAEELRLPPEDVVSYKKRRHQGVGLDVARRSKRPRLT